MLEVRLLFAFLLIFLGPHNLSLVAFVRSMLFDQTQSVVVDIGPRSQSVCPFVQSALSRSRPDIKSVKSVKSLPHRAQMVAFSRPTCVFENCPEANRNYHQFAVIEIQLWDVCETGSRSVCNPGPRSSRSSNPPQPSVPYAGCEIPKSASRIGIEMGAGTLSNKELETHQSEILKYSWSW